MTTKNTQKIPEFETLDDAQEWLVDTVDDPCIDNFRFAYLDDEKQIDAYAQIKEGGCCGFFDKDVIVDKRLAQIGCNYGH